MDQMTENVVETSGGGGVGPPESQPTAEDSRTLLTRYMVETVAPVLALLCMSALTVTLIVSVVTVVAHGGWLTPATYVSVDPWSTVHPDSGVARENGVRDLDSSVPADLSSGSQADAGYVAAGLPE